MYQVLDNGKPADCHHFDVDVSWDKSEFETFKEALTYAWNWLGESNVPLKVNEAWDYSGYGDMIEIKETERPSNGT